MKSALYKSSSGRIADRITKKGFFVCGMLLFITPFAAWSQPATQTPRADDPVVQMDKYVVTDTRVLPNPEQWTYVKVPALIITRGGRDIMAPGYELLSNLNSSQTNVLVQDLQLRQFAATTLWPMLTQTLPRAPIYVLVDINLQQSMRYGFLKALNVWDGDPIVASNVTPSPSSFNSAFSYSSNGSRAFADEYGLSKMESMNADSFDDTTLGNTESDGGDFSDMVIKKPEERADTGVIKPLPDGFVELATNGGPLTMLVHAGEPQAGIARPSEEQLASTMSFELNRFALESLPLKTPLWFARGLSNLLGATQVSHMEISFAAVRENMKGQNMPALLAVMQKKEPYLEEESRLASVFVHYGLFGENGKYASRFLQFVDRLGHGAEPSEQLFKETFGIGIKRMENEIATYGRTMAVFKSTKIKGIPDMPKFEQRTANQSEVARIKAEVFVSQNNPAKALDELRIAYWRGEREPAMLAMLAALEVQVGSEARARKILTTLIKQPAPPPQTFIIATQLRLKDILSTKPADYKLNATETRSMLDTLGRAVTGGITTEYLCGTLAEVILKSEVRPDADLVGFLEQAAKRYPKNQAIADAIKTGGAPKHT